MPRCGKVPGYLLHKPSGNARCIIEGRQVWLGRYGSDESHAKYQRIIAEWRTRHAAEPIAKTPDDQLTITEVIAAYWEHLVDFYGDTGKRRGTANNHKHTLRTVRKLYGDEPANEFGPLKLLALQQHWIDQNISRTHINEQTRRVKAMFRWAASRELIKPAAYHGLACVSGIAAGRTQAREGRKVRPVPDSIVDATVKHLTPTLAAMVKLLRLTGMRVGELCQMRPCDVDRSGPTWRFTVPKHKTQRFGKPRVVQLGPKAQEVLTPFLLRPAKDYCFTPRDSERQRLAARHAARKTPMSCGNRPSGRIRGDFKPCYCADSFRNAIRRVCDHNKIQPWHPHQLRHTRATELRAQFGVQGAQLILGHAKTPIVDVYAELDEKQAAEIAAKTG